MKDIKKDHLFDILFELSRAKVKFVVCGGVAAVLHGVERMTIDLDIAIDFRRDNVKKIITTMKRLGLTPRVPVQPEILYDKDKREFLINEKHAIVYTFQDVDNPFRQVDVFLSDAQSYPVLFSGSTWVKIGKLRIRVVSIQNLIVMKQNVRPRREKDLFDIKMLKKLLK